MTTWIDGTDFARYAPIPEELLPGWEGNEAEDVIHECVSAFRLAGHDVLTLGGEPLPVTWLAEPLAFARWYEADGDAGLLPAVHGAVDSDAWEDVLSVALGGRYVLTDAGYDADEILGSLRGARQPVAALRVELAPGRYRVQSLTVEPAPDTRFVLDRLLPE
ncbi:Imm21 family immunity protein [Streptomyces sp. NPDC058872]|uniref:Imm21 family immunity protein n=1 Tax=Streptomyces sp. NPDC058872 TaxID=3346661 RepID=UPI0036798A3C